MFSCSLETGRWKGTYRSWKTADLSCCSACIKRTFPRSWSPDREGMAFIFHTFQTYCVPSWLSCTLSAYTDDVNVLVKFQTDIDFRGKPQTLLAVFLHLKLTGRRVRLSWLGTGWDISTGYLEAYTEKQEGWNYTHIIIIIIVHKNNNKNNNMWFLLFGKLASVESLASLLSQVQRFLAEFLGKGCTSREGLFLIN